jgi:hypothetical protein
MIANGLRCAGGEGCQESFGLGLRLGIAIIGHLNFARRRDSRYHE